MPIILIIFKSNIPDNTMTDCEPSSTAQHAFNLWEEWEAQNLIARRRKTVIRDFDNVFMTEIDNKEEVETNIAVLLLMAKVEKEDGCLGYVGLKYNQHMTREATFMTRCEDQEGHHVYMHYIFSCGNGDAIRKITLPDWCADSIVAMKLFRQPVTDIAVSSNFDMELFDETEGPQTTIGKQYIHSSPYMPIYLRVKIREEDIHKWLKLENVIVESVVLNDKLRNDIEKYKPYRPTLPDKYYAHPDTNSTPAATSCVIC